MSSSGALEAFAKEHGLTYKSGGSLPPHGHLLTRGGHVEGLCEGTLPGGIEGRLAFYTYTYTTTDSDGHSETHTRRFTIVVTAVPQSIGFMPSLGFHGPESEMSGLGAGLEEMVKVDLEGHAGLKGARCYRYKGASETWTRRLFSPAFIDWLARSESDLGFELADGVLTTGRRRIGGELLVGLCEEAAHLTEVIAAESDEDSNVGVAAGDAAKDPNANDRRMEEALAAIAVALAAIELGLIAIFAFFIFRKDLRESGRKYAAEAFWRAYAQERGMKLEEPLRFAATHADAKLPFRPDKVLTGPLPGGGEGSFCVYGDGSKRTDRVAVVIGPAGPVAESELEAEPQGLTTKDLDTYLEQLAGEDRASAAPA